MLGVSLGGLPVSAHAAGKLEYNRDVRPILAENCFACHGPDSAARKAGLRLDIREEAIAKEAIAPGDPGKSELISRIFTDDASQLMPPPKSHKKLTPSQKAILKQWIVEGAEYQPHWAYIAPKRPVPPPVKDRAWVKNPIDQFVLAELEKRGLKPAPPADRWTLARRVAFDITGLPPDPKEVEAFVQDQSPNAYENYIDRLLKSPHWGEHRGRYWLDAARYADTHGIHFDNYREIWAYREWVIDAFNQNMPFDRFTIEQLAGDLLPNPTLEQRIASGFHRCNITTNEGGVIPEEYAVLYTRDRTETTATVWLGMTANCAVCHDHKFDPITQYDFYSLAAFFNNTTQNAMDGNIKDTPPVVVVPHREDRERWKVIASEIDQTRKGIEQRRQKARQDFDHWLKSATVENILSAIPATQLHLHARFNEGMGQEVQVRLDGNDRSLPLTQGYTWSDGHLTPKALQSKAGPAIELPEAGNWDTSTAFSVGAWMRLPRNSGFIGALVARMDENDAFRGWDLWIENGRIGAHLIHQWPDKAIKVVAQNQIPSGQWNHVLVTYDGSAKANGVKVYVNGVQQPITVQVDSLKGTIQTKVPLTIAQRHKASRLNDLQLQDVRLYSKALTPIEVERITRATRAASLIQKTPQALPPAEKEELFQFWLTTFDREYSTLNARLAHLNQEELAIRARGTVAHVMQERPGEAMAYILFRGEYDKRRDPVKPATPKVLPPMPAHLPKNRLGLAQWLLLPEHPLTARVTVNRFWQEVFGTGLVRTSGDFGIAGELPSHPELLDWLAIEFRESGWDVKRFFKLMLMSATYQQSAKATPEKLEKDPFNRYLSRGPRFRMDAEMIRDNALAVSGLLVHKLGGPSVKPYQPEGVWEAVAMIGSNTRDYRQDRGENLYRRSLYTFWKRSAPPASMEIFNAPNRETCTVRRERTNTPLQALVTLNDVQFIEAARVLAESALQHSPSDDARIHYLGMKLLSRPFHDAEKQIIRESLTNLQNHYRAHPEDARKLIQVGERRPQPSLEPTTLAAWTMLANQLMNLDEVLNK